MQLIGETIRHEQFGKGVVTACDHNIITIDFPTGKKRFVYPDAFQSFLIVKEGEAKEQINDLLVEQKLREKKKQLEDQARQQKLSRLRAMKISPNGQAVFALDQEQREHPFSEGGCDTGVYLSGVNKGEHRVPQQLAMNSMCILTDCPQGGPENQREILAVAMVPEGFEGNACHDGLVPFHDTFRLQLKKPLPLWRYLKKEPRKTWGHTAFRYISNQIGEEILYDIRKQFTGEELAGKFYGYFCDCNHLSRRA